MKPHTAPPWMIEVGSGGYLAVTDAEGEFICQLGEDDWGNAHLIQASGELLQACEALLSLLRSDVPPPVEEMVITFKTAEDAIMAAKGERRDESQGEPF